MSHRCEGEALPQRQFDEYLDGSSEVSYRYRQLGACSAPRALDDRVMQHVDLHLVRQQPGWQAAQPSQPRSAMRNRRLRWSASLAAAATLLWGAAAVLDKPVREEMAPAVATTAGLSASAQAAPVAGAPETSAKTAGARAEPASFRAGSVRDDQFFLGRREPATGVAPYSSSSSLVLSSTNAEREHLYVQVPPVTASAGSATAPAKHSEVRSGSGAALLDEDRRVDPKAWIARIRRAHAQGDDAQAAALLERLRAAHPGFAIPADISPQR